MLEPLQRITLSDEIIERFKRLIAAGDLSPGARLPGEIELARQLGVSRTSVREALKGLAALGLVVRSQEGTHVASDLDRPAIDSTLLDAAARGLDVTHLYETRRILEAAIAGLAAERATADDLRSLDEQMDLMTRSVASPPAFLRADLGFHLLVAQAAENPMLSGILSTVLGWLERTMPDAAALPEMPQLSLVHHRRLLDAIRAGDSARARAAARANLEEVEAIYLRHLRTRDAQAGARKE